MALGYENDSKRDGDGDAGDGGVMAMVIMLITTMTNMPDHSHPRRHTHAHTHAHTRASQHPRHTYPAGSHDVVSSSGFGIYPCWIEAQRKPRESCVPDPAHTSSVCKPTLRHEQPVAWGDH